MKAVNLIPAELRKGSSSAGHSGGLVYVVLAGLAILVVMTAALAGLGKVTNDRKAEATQLQAEATAVEARAGKLAHYEAAAAAARERVTKVRGLATSRFEWSHTFREVSRMLPNEAWVTSMVGTVGSGVSVEGSGNPLRAGVNSPALELSGCTRRQDSVAKLMAQLRGMDGVTRVALSASEKAEGATGAPAGAAAGGSSSDCRAGTDRPKFDLVVFFQSTGQQPTTSGAGTAQAPAAGAATGAANGSTGSGTATNGESSTSTTPSTSTGEAK